MTIAKITPCLWYDGTAEEAATLYTALLPDSRIDGIVRAPSDNPSTPEGAVLVVRFTLAGMAFIGLNGGPQFAFTEAVSFQIATEDQAETDRLSDALIEGGGAQSHCGWLKDRWGMSWQITPRRLTELIACPDPAVARRVSEAMLTMHRIDIAAIEAAAAGEPTHA
ncbi:VOC family protein [Sphingobium sufflavum]|uniref:VOC family protein n=1 Tax=Sphingobium sufflavum TaxID=1129547 RepID=UPI001F2F4766|nr:VOC family protein [Sphingobium sufflavum]MCE7795272.1 VOC family protein [Sphingobium sufflavum]